MPVSPITTTVDAASRPKRKLNYNDARELEQLPARIETLETRVADLAGQLNDPAFYQQGRAVIESHNAELAATQADLEAAYTRWSQLEVVSH